MKKNKGLLCFLAFISIVTAASLASGASNISNLFATTTPTPTTIVVYDTKPRLATQDQSNAIKPRVATQAQPDGSTLFVDYDNKYQLTLPKDWFIIPIEKADLDAGLDEFAQHNPNLAEAVEDILADPSVFRMASFNCRTECVVAGHASIITIIALERPYPMPLSVITSVMELTFPLQQGLKVLTGVNTLDNAHGIEMQYMDLEQSYDDGRKVPQRVIVFQSNKRVIMMMASTIPELKDEVFEVAKQIGSSIEPIE